MSDSLLSSFLAFGVPVLIATLASVLSVVTLGWFMANAGVAALIGLIVITLFVGPVLDPGFNVYTKGAGPFFFPIIQYYLYGLFLAVLFRDALEKRRAQQGAWRGWSLAFAALFGCHVAYGLATGVSPALLFSGIGLIHVIHMMMIAYVAVSVLRDENSVAVLCKAFLVVALTSACYGLGRFLFFGGDPQNAYASLGQMNLRITYWDFNEGLIASLVVFYCAGRLIRGWGTLSGATRAFLVAVLILELLVLLLSYRRTNWFGLVLAGCFFLWMLPRGRRAIAAGMFVVLALPPVVYLSTQRQVEALGRSNLTLLERIAPDVGARGSFTDRYARFYELYRAADSVMQSPLVGVGAWGEFDVGVSASGLEYHRGEYGYVHSGLGHVLLKSGFIGLTLFCALLFCAWRLASRARKRVPDKDLPVFDSCRAGLVFLVPVMLVGTPIIEFRSMALLGVLLAVPIALAALAPTPQVRDATAARPVSAAPGNRHCSWPARNPAGSR